LAEVAEVVAVNVCLLDADQLLKSVDKGYAQRLIVEKPKTRRGKLL